MRLFFSTVKLISSPDVFQYMFYHLLHCSFEMSEATPPELSNEKKTSKLGWKHAKQVHVISLSHMEISLKSGFELGNLWR